MRALTHFAFVGLAAAFLLLQGVTHGADLFTVLCSVFFLAAALTDKQENL